MTTLLTAVETEMEQVAIMAPSTSTSTVNCDELSDETESINLDLHVSDTEDVESLKKSEHDQAETEEDILNKFIDESACEKEKKEKNENEEEEKQTLPNGIAELPATEDTTVSSEKCNGVMSPIVNDEDEEMVETLKNDEQKEEEEKEETTEQSLSNDKNDEITDETILDKEITAEEKMVEECSAEEKSEEDVEKKEEVKETASDSNECKDSEQTDNKTIVDSDSDKKLDDVVNAEENIEELPKETETSDKSEPLSPPTNEDADVLKPTDDAKTDELEDNDDLLCVMDEKTVDDEVSDNKDENSCSASEKEEESKETENDDESKEMEQEDDTKEEEDTLTKETEEHCDETKEDEEIVEGINESHDMDADNGECAMDIEESDIGGVVYTDQNRDPKVSLPDEDANKENEHQNETSAPVNKSISADDNSKVAENGLTNGDVEMEEVEEQATEADVVTETNAESDETAKKTAKRQLSDPTEETERAKKMKLQEEKQKPVEKRPIQVLANFKRFMLDKQLKKLTRFELEEFCLQKMCECIVNKSEIGELRQKIMLQEQTIDTWRKEAIVVAKQTRDLTIVHERLMADLKAMKEQTGKPLVPVKITRSVGLQAIIENPTRVRPVTAVNGPSTAPRTIITSTNNTNNQNNQSKIINSPQTRQINKPKVPPPRIQNNNNNARPLQPIAQKDNNINNAKTRQINSSPQQKKNVDPKAVIDLTDEDEKNQGTKNTATTTTTASPTVRILNKQTANNSKQVTTTPSSQASKIMFVSPNVLQRNSTVMVKMNSNGLVSSQNGLTTIPNGQVSVVTTPVVRTVSQVRVPVSSVTTVRTTASQQSKQQLFKHPAPLPAAPIYQTVLPGKKPIPPKPHLNLTRSSCGTGIVLQWKMPYKLDSYETIVSYQLYAYQETKSPPKTDNWGKIGDVKALELPMAVTLTQFAVGNRYFFAVRAVDGQKRLGPFSDPENILL